MEYNYDVFISYSSNDQKVVEGICAYLEQHRIRCFVAYRDIPAGKVWASAIVDGLDSSRMMLVVFSDSFNTSDQVDREIELASEDKKPILTFRITDDAFRGAKKYYLKNINWIDAFPDPEHSFGHLLSNVCRLLGIEEQPKQTGEQPKPIVDQLNKPAPENRTSEQYDASRLDSMSDSERIAYLRKWAERGDARAQINLGDAYWYGQGVTKNYTDAVQWYRKAAGQGHARAQNDLGYMYKTGCGVTKDYSEAVKWYRKAAEQGLARAQNDLGYMYKTGCGVTKDYTEAEKWYRKASEQGDAAAQFNLGYLYNYGCGVTKDYAEAVKWYRMAAEQGVAAAQLSLAAMYEYGKGVEKDFAEAAKWYRKLAEQGNKDAIDKLKELGY